MSAHIYQKATKPTGWLFKAPMDNGSTRKRTFSNNHINLISTRSSCISLAEDKTKGRKTHRQTDNSGRKGQAKHDKEGNPYFRDANGFQTKSNHYLKGFSTKHQK